jgi:hypothetical protein
VSNITSYSTLVSEIDGASGWLHRTLTDRIPQFVQMCEADMQTRCKLVEFEASATVTITAGVGTLPTDLVAMRSVYWDGSPDYPLEYLTPAQFDAMRGSDTGDGYYYTISGSTIRTTPMGSGSVVLTYNARFTPISASNQTNSIITNYPDAYLFGTMAQAGLYLVDDAMAQKWGALFTNALARINSDNEQRKYAGATLAVRAR